MNTIKTKLVPPEGYELDKENSTFEEIVWKPIDNITYSSIAKKLFGPGHAVYRVVSANGDVSELYYTSYPESPSNCVTETQVRRNLLRNKLENIAYYLNDGWKPDWNNYNSCKYYIYFQDNNFEVSSCSKCSYGAIYFKSKALAEQAIKIMGRERLLELFI